MHKQVIDTFIKIVQIGSESGNEKNMCTYIKKWAHFNNFIIKEDRIGNILLKNKGKKAKLLLCAHLDTVKPGINITPIINKNTITSSGNSVLGADNKASVASIMTAIEILNHEKKSIPCEVLFTVREEIGGGCEFFSFQLIDAQKGFTFDCAQPLGGIVLRSPYIINFHIHFHGKPAHSSDPHKGKNALIPALKTLQLLKIGTKQSGKTTINIGMINGGNGLNIIPHSVEFAGEIRSFEKHLFEDCIHKLEKIVAQETKKTETMFSISTNGYCPGYLHKKTNPFIRKIKKIYELLNIKSFYIHSKGVSDANILNNAGIEIINLSDGVENPHTYKEQIQIQHLISLTELITMLLKNHDSFYE